MTLREQFVSPYRIGTLSNTREAITLEIGQHLAACPSEALAQTDPTRCHRKGEGKQFTARHRTTHQTTEPDATLYWMLSERAS